MPEIRYPAPADLAPAAPWQPKHLATPAELALVLVPQQRRRFAGLPMAVRLGRRTGRRP
jgi:hypothetical protein